MSKSQWWKSLVACAIGVGMYGVVVGEAHAGQAGPLLLQGSGPVYTRAVKPGARTVKVTVSNNNNFNVGFDLLDVRSGGKILNGTIKNRGNVTKLGTAHAGRTYHLRLRCQEPNWNHTKCNAEGVVKW
jgi:hypothetical protein